jgi:hypothetical protein
MGVVLMMLSTLFPINPFEVPTTGTLPTIPGPSVFSLRVAIGDMIIISLRTDSLSLRFLCFFPVVPLDTSLLFSSSFDLSGLP